MAERAFLAIAGFSGAVSVGADAAARHLLAGDATLLEFATIAARYGLIHAAALVGVAALLHRNGDGFWLAVSGWLFVAGLALFCGSLDLVAAGAPVALTRLTPWGGTAFILGWLALLVAALMPRRAE